MTGRQDLNDLERGVEQARASLISDLHRLRDPETMTAARSELDSYRDAGLERARAAAASTTSSALAEIRARMEANPAGALVLGAGVAWKLLRDPPIAALLFFAGLASLINTKPAQSGSRTPTTDAILSARDQAMESVRRTATAAHGVGQQIGDHAREARDQASAHVATMVDQARETASQAAAQAAVMVEEAEDALTRAASNVSARASDFSENAGTYAARANQSAWETARAHPLATAAAALALGVALGMISRRTNDGV